MYFHIGIVFLISQFHSKIYESLLAGSYQSSNEQSIKLVFIFIWFHYDNLIDHHYKLMNWICVHSGIEQLPFCTDSKVHNTVEPHYNEVLGTMKITLLYQVSHAIRVKKLRDIKRWDQQNYLVIRGFCYIQPLYDKVPLYTLRILVHTCSYQNKRQHEEY